MFPEEASRIGELARSDPSFGRLPAAVLQEAEAKLAATATPDRFRLEAHRLMALAGNGHSRIIANRTARVVPLRFLWLADGPCLAEGPHLGARLVAVNGVGVPTLFRALRPLLAGTRQRARALAGFMLAWPPAIALATGDPAAPRYRLRTIRGERLDIAGQDTVAAEPLYPGHERGPAARLICASGLAETQESCAGIFHRPLPRGLAYLRIGDLSAGRDRVAAQLEPVLDSLGATRGLVVDLRGNPGGSFFGALGFARRLREVAPGAAVVVLVDKFTFSAALVTAALLKVHAGARIVGEEMGDSGRFHAEGGLEALPRSGLDVRYSDGWHDWAEGRVDPLLTPRDIAAETVAAGSLRPALSVGPAGRDLAEGRDAALARAIGLLSG